MAEIKTALVVEDDPVQQQLIKAYLESRQVETCLVANNGTEAMALVGQHKASLNLITCDLNMPDGDGIEFIEHLKREKIDIPIILITSAKEFIIKSAEMLAKAHGLPFFGVVRKPTKVWELNKVLAPLFGQ